MGKNEEEAERKRKIRGEALRRRDDMTEPQRRAASEGILERLTGLSCYQEADAILTYISFRSEADTFPLLERAFADGKAVFAPKVMGRDMEFCRIFSADDLAEGYRGIREPKGGISYSDLNGQFRALICMPGAAFDRARHRIGYGGGFYDRYVGRLLENGVGADVSTAALAFSCQIFEKIPWEEHDICPERIVTEREIF